MTIDKARKVEIKAKGKGLAPLVRKLRVKVVEGESWGIDVYSTQGIEGQEFDAVAIGIHTWEDNSSAAVAWLATPKGIREVALEKLIVVSTE